MVLILGGGLIGSDARAVLVAIKYYDRAVVNPEFAGGPLWTGFVDTVADTLTINAWTELPLHGADYWVPRNLVAPPGVSAQPLVWPARKANGDEYDVPDTFDGHIDNSFAFISDQHLREMQWKVPVFSNTNPPTLLRFDDVEYTLNTGDVWPGWGGWALQVPGSAANDPPVKEFRTIHLNESGQPVLPLFDEHIMPALPIRHVGATQPTYISSSNAIITATRYATSTSAVPEARQWMALPVALFLAFTIRWLTQRGRAVAE